MFLVRAARAGFRVRELFGAGAVPVRTLARLLRSTEAVAAIECDKVKLANVRGGSGTRNPAVDRSLYDRNACPGI